MTQNGKTSRYEIPLMKNNYLMNNYRNQFNFSTLVDLLQCRAQHHSTQVALTFLQDGEQEEKNLTYEALDLHSRVIATQLQALNVCGERALLLYPPGLDYISAFFGCLYAGVIAVPAYPPRRNRSLFRLQSIFQDAQPTVVLTTAELLADWERWFSSFPDFQALHWITTNNITNKSAEEWLFPDIGGDTLALLQYTSGSTATPKGVMIDHKNLLSNLALIHERYELTLDSRVLSWLPPYHDMGLVGGILQPLYAGISMTLMSPVMFLQRPLRWLQAISRYKATISGGPNFAYDLCVRKVSAEQRANLDLSSWSLAFNGAEPINNETLDRFTRAFECCGFRREAFYPCYGLAEATLLVSGGSKDIPPVLKTLQRAALEQNRVIPNLKQEDESRILVGCGQLSPQQRVVIVHPESLTPCSSNEVGEIWISSASVAQGYWNNPIETERTFRACLAEMKENSFLRTGDLGFVEDGELFVTGRIKDLIVIRGRNYYPQDLELTVETSHSIMRLNCGAAFTIDVDGQEQLVIVQEIERHYRSSNLDDVVAAIRRAIAEQYELQTYAVSLIKTGSIPKTSSGKIQRHTCRASFLSKSLDVIHHWTETSTSQEELKQLHTEEPNSLQQTFSLDRNSPSVKRESGQRYKNLETIQSYLISHIANRLNIETRDMDVSKPFFDYGFNRSSRNFVRFRELA
jgi:acyl-CoA synthetase (AMP-forming)/AMP-acid ligase II